MLALALLVAGLAGIDRQASGDEVDPQALHVP